jgi:thiol-disulfide isomerase/thioredoxin
MRKALHILASVLCLVAYGKPAPELQKTGYVVAIFDNAPYNAALRLSKGRMIPIQSPDVVSWMEGDLFLQKGYRPAEEGSDTISIPTRDGFAEIAHRYKGSSHVRFLLREGDTVRIEYDAAGYPRAKSLLRPEMDRVYNFPASVDGLMLANGLPAMTGHEFIRTYRTTEGRRMLEDYHISSSEAREGYEAYRTDFMAALAETDMPTEYKTYYAENYFSPDEPVYDDARLRYFSNRWWLILRSNEMMVARMGNDGSSEVVEPGAMAGLFDSLSGSGMPPLSKAVMLRRVLTDGIDRFENVNIQQEYTEKYMALTGDRSVTPPQLRFSADELHLEDGGGNPTTFADLLARHKGKLVYVDFWASWCTPCLAAMPEAEKLRAEHPEVVFVYLSVDRNPKGWLAATKRLGLPESYLVMNPQASRMMKELDVRRIPRYLLFDRDGNMVYNQAPGPKSAGKLFE